MPVWNGVPTGPVTASMTDLLNADQFYVHALLDDLRPGETYHYRFAYRQGSRPATPPTPPSPPRPTRSAREPFTFTAYGDQGITGAPGTGLTIDNAHLDAAGGGLARHRRLLRPHRPGLLRPDVDDGADRHLTRSPPWSPRSPGSATRSTTRRPGSTCWRATSATPTRAAMRSPSSTPTAPAAPSPGDTNTPAPPANSGGWDDFDPYVWTSYFSTIEPSSASTPWMFATGNHDVELFHAELDADATTIGYYGSIGYGGHAKRLDLPKNGPSKCPSVYSFSYGNVAVVSVDANDLSYEIQGLLGYSDGTQAAWLKQTLAAFRADPSIDFIVVFFHHCAFSTCSSHSSDGGVRRRWPAVRRVPSGPGGPGPQPPLRADQPHPLRRGHQQRVIVRPGGLPVAPEAAVVHPAKDGTTYVVVGSGGRPRYAWSGSVENDRNFIAGVDTSDPGNGATWPPTRRRSRPYVSQRDFTDLLRDDRLVAGPVPRLRLHRPRRRPIPRGGTTTMTLRAINQQGVEFDRVVFKRTAR